MLKPTDVLARIRRVDLDRVAIDGGEALPPVGKSALAARLRQVTILLDEQKQQAAGGGSNSKRVARQKQGVGRSSISLF